MIMRMPLLTALFIALMNISCSRSVSGGNTSETVNCVAAQVYNDTGETVHGGKAYIIDAGNWYSAVSSGKSVVADSVITDAQGYLSADSLGSGNYNLIVYADSEVVMVKDIMLEGGETQNLGALYTEIPASVSGFVETDTGITDTLYIRGTHLKTGLNNEGEFTFRAIPCARNHIYAGNTVTGDDTYLDFVTVFDVASGEEINNDTLYTSPLSIIIDNFEDNDSIPLIAALSESARWETYTDWDKGGNSRIVPDLGNISFDNALITGNDAYRGYSFSALFVMGDELDNPYATIRCNFSSDTEKYFDFSDMQELSFRLKGKDSIRVGFASKLVKSYPDTCLSTDLGVTVTASQDWERISVKPEDILPAPGTMQEEDGVSWDDINNEIYAIYFGSWAHYPDTVEIYLDNVKIKGVDADVFEN